MFWDDLVRRWRRDLRARDPEVLRAAGGHVAVYPAPHRARRTRSPLMALLVLVALALLLLFVVRPSGAATSTPPPASTGFVAATA
jgi:hypothetical protein